MLEINVSQEFIGFLREREDKVFLNKLQVLFRPYNKEIMSSNDALMLMDNSSNIDLNEQVYKLLDEVDEGNKLFVYDMLIASKFPKKRLAERLIKDIFTICDKSILDNESENIVWFYCENLRVLKQMCFLDDYLKMLHLKKLGICRQPIIDLLSYSRNKNIVEELILHLNDNQINGHILLALKKCKYTDLNKIASMFLNDERQWVREFAHKNI